MRLNEIISFRREYKLIVGSESMLTPTFAMDPKIIRHSCINSIDLGYTYVILTKLKCAIHDLLVKNNSYDYNKYTLYS